MKIQELAIVFIIILLPISLILSEFTQFQIRTLNTQTLYDAKLTSATYDAIKAYQLNSQNETYSDLADQKSSDLEASVSAFRNSIKSAFELTGYTEDDLNNYIPALVYTLYDGLQIYSPYINTNHKYETDDEQNIVYDPTTGEPIGLDGNGESLFGFKPYINYSCRYIKGNIDVIITYTLDNYITVQGKINNEYVNKSGYLIDDIDIIGDDVYYNSIKIEKESLFENVGWTSTVVPYYKQDGTKYYRKDANNIVYISNGIEQVQYSSESDLEQFNDKLNLMINNDFAQQYYKSAKEFTNWLKEETNLDSLTYDDAYDEIIDETTGDIILGKVWDGNYTPIFEDTDDNIENDSSNFNQHRLAVIRHKIETNLAIAISNYNAYAGAASNIFQMPELKEDEWEHITNNISLISFLQGLPIGGKIYNGYTLVTNSESEEVVSEENIYILGSDGAYHRIGDNYFEDGTVSVNSSIYSYGTDSAKSAGRLNLDFIRNIYLQSESTIYYYPLKAYNASYNSIVMQNDVTTYDDIYEYVNSQSDDLKKAFYTALGRERAGKYKSNVIIDTGTATDGIRTYTIAYSANGGIGSTIKQTKVEGRSVSLKSKSTFVAPSGKHFLHWNTNPTGSGTIYRANETYSIDSDIVLYAIWTDHSAACYTDIPHEHSAEGGECYEWQVWDTYCKNCGEGPLAHAPNVPDPSVYGACDSFEAWSGWVFTCTKTTEGKSLICGGTE